MLSAEAASRLGRPEQELLGALQAREQLGSTALGRGVALPHARLGGDGPPVTIFARLLRPIDFEARDDEPVDLIFLVLWLEASSEGFLLLQPLSAALHLHVRALPEVFQPQPADVSGC